MLSFFQQLFDTSDFPARWYCGRWDEGLGWLHICSDIATWGAYTAIPLVLIYYVRKRKDFPFHRLFWLFATFILACGSVHLVEATIFWFPVYRFSGLLKLVMATVSWATVIALIKITPSVLHLPSLVATNEKLSQEIEQRLKSESDLRILQARNEAILAGTRSIVWTCSRTFAFTEPQHSWERYTGQPWEEHRERGWLHAVLPEDRQSLLEKWQQAASRPAVFRSQGNLWHHHSQSFRPFIIEAVPVIDQEGNIQEWVGTVSDIHEQREAEQALKLAEAEALRHQSELELIYNTAPIGMCLFNRELRYIRINDALAKMNGLPREAHYGKRMPDLLPDIASKNVELYEQVFQTGNALLDIELKGKTPANETDHYWLVNYHPLKDETGNVWAVSSIIQDITERKHMELALRDSEARANVANTAKSQFLANMSHEIRTPMAVILGYSEILKSNLQNPDNLQCLSIIQRNGEHLLDIINDILDLSRIEAGKIELQIQSVSLQEVVSDLLTTMKVRADQKALKLYARAVGKLPSLFQTDPTRLRQILINLVGNSLKFTSSGEVVIECRLIDGADGSWIEFKVIDSGIGIPEQVQSSLFAPFSQGDASITRSYGGTGLGLAITKRSVEMLGGTISFVSKPGQGTTFTVQLPCGEVSEDMLSEVAFNTPTPSGPNDRCQEASHHSTATTQPLNCRVLVADDRRDVRYLTQHFLETAGAKVVTVEDGLQAINEVRKSFEQNCPFDVIIMDMQMPKMDGKSAIKVLRADGVSLPIIALTADAMKGDREKYLEIGCDDYIAKPIDQRDLLQMVRTYSQRASTQANLTLDLLTNQEPI